MGLGTSDPNTAYSLLVGEFEKFECWHCGEFPNGKGKEREGGTWACVVHAMHACLCDKKMRGYDEYSARDAPMEGGGYLLMSVLMLQGDTKFVAMR